MLNALRAAKWWHGAVLALTLTAGCEQTQPAPEGPIATPAGLDPEVRQWAEKCRKAVLAAPNDAEAYGQLGLVYEANSLYGAAITCFESAARLAPEVPIWSYHVARSSEMDGDMARATTELEELTRRFPDFAPGQHLYGNVLLEDGRVDDAERAFQRAVELRAKSPEGHVGLGRVALERRDYTGAVAHLEKAIARRKNHGIAHFLIGTAYRRLDRKEDADRAQARGIDAEKPYMFTRTTKDLSRYAVGFATTVERSTKLLAAGMYDDAITVLEKLYGSRPQNTTVMNNLAVAYHRKGRLADALGILHKALAVDETEFATYINLSDVHLTKRDPEAALAAADAAVLHGPRVSHAHFARGRALARLRRNPEARAALEESLRLDSRNPAVSRKLAEVCLRLKDDAGALPHIQRTVDLSPDDLPAWVNLFIVAMRLDRHVVAEHALARSRALGPNTDRVKQIEDLWQRHLEREPPPKKPEEKPPK